MDKEGEQVDDSVMNGAGVGGHRLEGNTSHFQDAAALAGEAGPPRLLSEEGAQKQNPRGGVSPLLGEVAQDLVDTVTICMFSSLARHKSHE